MKNISIFGTSSDTGKSTLTFVIAKLLQEKGVSTIAFKAQNVSNNSQVADDGTEIAISTHFQNSVLGVETSYHVNPVLLKSGAKNAASLIIKGREMGEKDVKNYYKDLDTLKPIVKESFSHLSYQYDCVVAEGAGGCVELNLLEKDLSNTFIADTFDTKIILVADIEKGGVFASVYGTVALLQEKFKENLIGVVINKFRGDRSLFDDGVKIIEERFGVPVLGVLPYIPLNIGFEDSASLQNYAQNQKGDIKVGIIKLPHISNFNDFEPLIIDEELEVAFITSNLDAYDWIIIPGSKRVVSDLLWMKHNGLFEALLAYEKKIIGICGGYEMMFETIIDETGIESEISHTKGLGFIKGKVYFSDEKVVKKSQFKFHNMSLKGYEIHYAKSVEYPLFYENESVFGTFVHGIFDNDAFRNYLFGDGYIGYSFEQRKSEILDTFINTMGKHLDMDRVMNSIETL
ncbi:MAG: cobyric acid synthase [Epsilonproteobacteria bacterium]|nr:cobyric acid synthase [Campylobacterota bacterium]